VTKVYDLGDHIFVSPVTEVHDMKLEHIFVFPDQSQKWRTIFIVSTKTRRQKCVLHFMDFGHRRDKNVIPMSWTSVTGDKNVFPISWILVTGETKMFVFPDQSQKWRTIFIVSTKTKT
jgi:hypothetical protein